MAAHFPDLGFGLGLRPRHYPQIVFMIDARLSRKYSPKTRPLSQSDIAAIPSGKRDYAILQTAFGRNNSASILPQLAEPSL